MVTLDDKLGKQEDFLKMNIIKVFVLFVFFLLEKKLILKKG